MESSIYKLLMEHLPVLGFEVQIVGEPPAISAHHKIRPSVAIREIRGGAYFLAPFPSLEKAPLADVLALMNECNKKMFATRVYISKESIPFFEGWLPGSVDKQGVTLFLDLFSDDVSRSWDDVKTHLLKE